MPVCVCVCVPVCLDRCICSRKPNKISWQLIFFGSFDRFLPEAAMPCNQISPQHHCQWNTVQTCMFYAFYHGLSFFFFFIPFSASLSHSNASNSVCMRQFFSVFQFIFSMSFCEYVYIYMYAWNCDAVGFGVHTLSKIYANECNVSLINSQIITNYTVCTQSQHVELFQFILPIAIYRIVMLSAEPRRVRRWAVVGMCYEFVKMLFLLLSVIGISDTW